jgi:hypothetical protein
MAGERRPHVGATHAVHDGAVAAGGLAEHRAAPAAAAAELALDERHHFVDQVILVAADGGGVDVLVAAEARIAIGEGDGHRAHGAAADQAVQPFRHVLGEGLPVGMRQA